MAKSKSTNASSPKKDLQARLRDLVKISQKQGHLTYENIKEALPDKAENKDEIETTLTFFQNLESDIKKQAGRR